MREGAVDQQAADTGAADSTGDATLTVAPNDEAPRTTDPPRSWTRPGDTIHTGETGCARLFPSLEGEIPFSRELLYQIAQRLRGATEDEVDVAGSFDRLEALLSIRLPVRANTLDRRDTWETPVDHVLQPLFRDSAEGGRDLESLILARRDDRVPPPQYLSAESIANAVASMSKLYADLTGMYGEDRLFERVVNTARSTAWLSHVTSTLFDVACATEHRVVAEPGDARLATIMALENRLRVAETRSRVLQSRPAAQCNQCQENLNRVEDLRAFMANLEAAKTGLAISVGELTTRLDAMQTQLQRRTKEYQDARDRIFELEDEVRGAEVSQQQKVIATKARAADTYLLSKRQAWNVYKFCWRNSAAYGDPNLWWQLVTACALDKTENLPPVQLMVTAAPLGVPDTGDAPDLPSRLAAWAPPPRDRESSEEEKDELGSSSRRKASRDASTQMTLTAEFDKELSDELAGGSSPDSSNSVVDVDVESTGGSDTGELPSRKTSATTVRASSASKQRFKRKAADADAPATHGNVTSTKKQRDTRVDVDPYTGLPVSELSLWMQIPVRKPSESPTTTVFTLHSSPPFALGAIRSVNSKLQYRQPADKHRDKIAGYPTQAIAIQTPYFPNYEVVKNKGKHLLARYCTTEGVRELKTLFRSRPWDAMWEGRVLVFFLVDPTQLSDPQIEWILKRIRFQYEYRQVFWLLTHWLYIARTPNAEQSRAWSNLYANREGLKKVLRAKSAQIDSEAPPGTCTALLQSEPALWVEPRKPCPWALEEFDEGSSAIEQVQALDDVEPIRCYWAGHHGRFVEALLPDQLKIMDGHGGQCWELPTPWNDPKYTPIPLDQVTPGTPGPEYLFQDPRTTLQSTPLAE